MPSSDQKVRLLLSAAFGTAVVVAGAAVTAGMLWWPASHALSSTDAELLQGLRLHLGHVAHEPRPVGSEADARACSYIVTKLREYGYEPLLDEDNILPHRAAFVAASAGKLADSGRLSLTNIIATKKGTQDDHEALILMAHYDSVPYGPGAADDGAAVAALLETMRWLAAERTAKTVTAIFTDGEESGRLGVRLLLMRRRLVDRNCSIVNFDARGSSGRLIMFESSMPNDRLASRFLAGPQPFLAFSLGAVIYRFMPNRTDFDILRDRGFGGLNFAFIGSPENYHRPSDTIHNLSEQTLMEIARTMRAITMSWNGGADSPSTSTEPFFSIPGGLVVALSTWQLRVIAAMLFAVALCSTWNLSMRRKTVRWMIVGCLSCAGVTILCALRLRRESMSMVQLALAPHAQGSLTFGAFGIMTVLAVALQFNVPAIASATRWVYTGFAVTLPWIFEDAAYLLILPTFVAWGGELIRARLPSLSLTIVGLESACLLVVWAPIIYYTELSLPRSGFALAIPPLLFLTAEIAQAINFMAVKPLNRRVKL